MLQKRTVRIHREGRRPRQVLRRRRWRSQAWRWAEAGRRGEALALQRALVASPIHVSPRQRLRDRFRLLRWELSLGSWMEARELVAPLETDLRAQGIAGGPVLVWLRSACSVAQFQLGEGLQSRRILASAVRGSREMPGRAVRLSVLRLALVQARLSREPGGEEPASGRRLSRLRVLWREALPARIGRSMEDGEAPPAVTSEWFQAVAQGPVLGSWGFSWDQLPALIQGPAETTSLRALSDPLRPAQGSAAESERGPGPARPWVLSWLDYVEQMPPSAGPAWLVSVVAGQIEEWVSEICVADRGRCHRALSLLADRVKEPWARAAVLEALAETSLWLAQNGHPETPAWPALESALARARHDLALAAGLLGRMGWKERAAACERRWARLTWPVLGPSLAGSEPHRATRQSPLRPSLNWVRRSLADAGFITGDPRVLRELTALVLLAPTPLPVLILGESGTGKEVIARAIHRWSQLRGEFVPIHCGAIPRELLESELFGHTRGAFTGAATDKAGLVEAANGGSLFLDEIGEMGREAQMKMLRVLESGEVRRLGDLKHRRAQLRLIAATHCDLDEAVRTRCFRLDLFHRIRGITVFLRPLRERRGDIPLLTAHVLAQAAAGGPSLQLPERSMVRLLGHDWPGNVRELRSALLRSAHLCRALGLPAIPPEFLELGPSGGKAQADAASLAERVSDLSTPGGSTWLDDVPVKELLASAGLEAVLEDMERRLIVGALEENGWNRTHAARSLGNISRTTLLSKMKRLGIQAVGGAAVAGEADEGAALQPQSADPVRPPESLS